MAGDNNLDEFGLMDIGEMKKVGSSDDVDVVVQFDRAAGKGATCRYHLRKGTKLTADVVQRLGETDAGDPKVAIDFFTWGMREYPSDKVLAVIWNHGSGIDETDVYARGRRITRRSDTRKAYRGLVRGVTASRLKRSLFASTVDAALSSRAIAYDDTSRDFLDNAELSQVLSEVVGKVGRRIDVLGFDACLMNMVEVAYELQDLVGHVVASEEVEPGDGWPYDKVIGELRADPDQTGAQLATAIVKDYLDSYTASDGVTDSAVDVSRVAEVATAVDQLAQSCIASTQSDADYAVFARAVAGVQRFQVRDFVDLGDLARRLGAGSPRQELKDAAGAVLAALAGARPFVIAEGHKGANLSAASGTAIYFPAVGDVHVAYDRLAFARKTRWAELIHRYQRA
jgi:hypothetical protein